MSNNMKRMGRRVFEQTRADAIIDGLRADGIWAERLPSGCKKIGNLIYDTGARGLPQVWLPELGASLMVQSNTYTADQVRFMEKAKMRGTRFALVADLDAAKKAIEQWTS